MPLILLKMPLTKVITRRTEKGVALLAPNATRNKRACNKRLVSVTTVSDQNHVDAKNVPISSSDQVSNKLDALVKAVLDLSRFKLQKSTRKWERLHLLPAAPPLVSKGGPNIRGLRTRPKTWPRKCAKG